MNPPELFTESLFSAGQSSSLQPATQNLPPTPMKLAALCCTFRRPHLLGELIESFLRQDYPRPLRELIILDDSGQYDHQQGDGRARQEAQRRQDLGDRRHLQDAADFPVDVLPVRASVTACHFAVV